MTRGDQKEERRGRRKKGLSPQISIIMTHDCGTFFQSKNNCLLFQDQARDSKATPMSPDDADEAESPLPAQVAQSVRRRGAISAEPITEEDVASYVKKVNRSQSAKLPRSLKPDLAAHQRFSAF